MVGSPGPFDGGVALFLLKVVRRLQRQLFVEGEVVRRELLQLVGDAEQFRIILGLRFRSLAKQHVLDRLRQLRQRLAVAQHAGQRPVARLGLAAGLRRPGLLAGLCLEAAVGLLGDGGLLGGAELAVLVLAALQRLPIGDPAGGHLNRNPLVAEFLNSMLTTCDFATAQDHPIVVRLRSEDRDLEQAKHRVHRWTIFRNEHPGGNVLVGLRPAACRLAAVVWRLSDQ
jgi:hypothetical protein